MKSAWFISERYILSLREKVGYRRPFISMSKYFYIEIKIETIQITSLLIKGVYLLFKVAMTMSKMYFNCEYLHQNFTLQILMFVQIYVISI